MNNRLRRGLLGVLVFLLVLCSAMFAVACSKDKEDPNPDPPIVEPKDEYYVITEFDTYEELTSFGWYNTFGKVDIVSDPQYVKEGETSMRVEALGDPVNRPGVRPRLMIPTETQYIDKVDYSDVDKYEMDVYNASSENAVIYFSFTSGSLEMGGSSSETRITLAPNAWTHVEIPVDRSFLAKFIVTSEIMEFNLYFEARDSREDKAPVLYFESLKAHLTDEPIDENVSVRVADELESADRPEYISAWTPREGTRVEFNTDPQYIRGDGAGSFKLVTPYVDKYGGGEDYCQITLTNNMLLDISGYESIYFYLYNAQDKDYNIVIDGSKSIPDEEGGNVVIKPGWNLIDMKVEWLASLSHWAGGDLNYEGAFDIHNFQASGSPNTEGAHYDFGFTIPFKSDDKEVVFYFDDFYGRRAGEPYKNSEGFIFPLDGVSFDKAESFAPSGTLELSENGIASVATLTKPEGSTVTWKVLEGGTVVADNSPTTFAAQSGHIYDIVYLVKKGDNYQSEVTHTYICEDGAPFQFDPAKFDTSEGTLEYDTITCEDGLLTLFTNCNEAYSDFKLAYDLGKSRGAVESVVVYMYFINPWGDGAGEIRGNIPGNGEWSQLSNLAGKWLRFELTGGVFDNKDVFAEKDGNLVLKLNWQIFGNNEGPTTIYHYVVVNEREVPIEQSSDRSFIAPSDGSYDVTAAGIDGLVDISAPSSAAVTWKITAPDGTQSAESPATYSFATAGMYTVEFTVADGEDVFVLTHTVFCENGSPFQFDPDLVEPVLSTDEDREYDEITFENDMLRLYTNTSDMNSYFTVTYNLGKLKDAVNSVVVYVYYINPWDNGLGNVLGFIPGLGEFVSIAGKAEQWLRYELSGECLNDPDLFETDADGNLIMRINWTIHGNAEGPSTMYHMVYVDTRADMSSQRSFVRPGETVYNVSKSGIDGIVDITTSATATVTWKITAPDGTETAESPATYSFATAGVYKAEFTVTDGDDVFVLTHLVFCESGSPFQFDADLFETDLSAENNRAYDEITFENNMLTLFSNTNEADKWFKISYDLGIKKEQLESVYIYMYYTNPWGGGTGALRGFIAGNGTHASLDGKAGQWMRFELAGSTLDNTEVFTVGENGNIRLNINWNIYGNDEGPTTIYHYVFVNEKA